MRRAAWIAFFAHLISGLAMLGVLRHGLETNPDLADRLRFLAENRWAWRVSWLCWHVAAFSILWFYRVFARVHRANRAPLILGALAVAGDLAAQNVEMWVLPALAARHLGSPDPHALGLFQSAHRGAVLLTGCLANAFYTLAAGLLAWKARGEYAGWINAAAAGVVAAGAWLSAAACLDSAAGMFWSNVFLVPALLAWLAGVALRAPTGS